MNFKRAEICSFIIYRLLLSTKYNNTIITLLFNMTIDFKKHLLIQLQNDPIYNLPSIEVINSDINFALAVWKNFSVYSFQNSRVSIDSWYSAGNWKNNLEKYKEDINFWKVALEEGNFKYEVLLHENFQKDFPFITQYYLKSNERLQELYYKTNKEEFFNLIDLSEDEKYKIKQYYYAEKGSNVSQDFITKYEHDQNFILKLLTKNCGYFKCLNEENRDNPEYIKLALTNNPLNFEYLSEVNKDITEYIKLAFNRKTSIHIHKVATNFHLLSDDRKINLFSGWLTHFGQVISGSDITKLNELQREEAFRLRPELLGGMLQNQSKKYGTVAAKLLNEDFDKYIPYVNEPMLFVHYKNLEDTVFIKDNLDQYINEYIPKTKLSKKDKNILYLIGLDESLIGKLNSNVGYQINVLINKPDKISEETFFTFVDKMIALNKSSEVTIEQCDSYITSLRSKLESSVQKELRLPKVGTFNYLCMLKLNEKLQATLPTKIEKSKNKI